MTAKAAVVGWPIQHSLSPVLHGHWLNHHGIDGTYEKIAIEPGNFAARVAELRAAAVFQDSILFRQFRLSVVPLTDEQYDWLVA